jgi:hypothetical protein
VKFENDEVAKVKILTAGDEMSLEEKVNEYLEANTDQTLTELIVEQVEYHARNGTIDFGLIAVMVMRVKRAAVAARQV